MASYKLNNVAVSTSDDEDYFCGSVDHFSSIFANLQREKEIQHNIQTESMKEISANERKMSEEKKSQKSKVGSSKTEESKEEKLEKIRQEMAANKDIDELRLLDDIDDILLEKKVSPKRNVEAIPVFEIPEMPNKKAKKGKGKKKGKASSPELVKLPVTVVSDLDLSEIEDVYTPTPSLPTKFASIHVSWKEETYMYSVNLYDKVSLVRQRVSQSSKTRAEDIVLYFGEDILEDDKTLLEAGINRGDTLEAMKAGKSAQVNDPAMLKLKCQTVNRRETFHIHIRKTTGLHQLRDDVAEKLGLAPECVKLQFDGETLDLEETPESMELENGYCIDVYTS